MVESVMETPFVCGEIWGGHSRVARSIQLPRMSAYVVSIPHGDAKAGGDIYYLTACGESLVHRALIVDVMGHGEAASGFAEVLSHSLRANIAIPGNGEILQALDAAASDRQRQCATRGPDSQRPVFATCGIGTFDHSRGLFRFSYAGHHATLLRRGAEWQALSMGVGDAFPLGVADRQSHTTSELRLESGDWLLMYSDGLLDAFGLGTVPEPRELDSLFGSIRETQPGPYFDRLVARLTQKAEDKSLADDLTVMLLVPQIA